VIKFGLKRIEKQKKQPLFDFPYLVVGEKPKDTGRVCKFWLENTRDLLKFKDIDNKLSWLYDEAENKFFLINVTDATEEVSPLITVNLGFDFNNKQLHDRIVKVYDLDPNMKHTFELISVDPIEGFPAVMLGKIPELLSTEELSLLAELQKEDDQRDLVERVEELQSVI